MQTSQRLQVGIDVSKRRLDFACLAPDGQPIEIHQPFPNTQPGYERAQSFLLATLAEHGLDGLDVAAEATSYYWLPAFLQFHQDPELANYDLHLYLLNARWVRWYKRSLPPDHKDDPTDPQYIADRIRTRKPAYTWEPAPKWLALRLLTRLHFHLSKAIVREKNLFQLYLFLMYTTYSSGHPFQEAFSQISRSLVCEPEHFQHLADLSLEEQAEYLDDLSGHHLKTPLGSAQALQQVLHERYPLPPELEATLQVILPELEGVIHDLEDRQKHIDQAIQQRLAQGDYPEVAWLDSIPGVGPILSAGLAAEIAGLERFQQVQKWDKRLKRYRPRHLSELEDAIGKLAGLWWPKNASGQFEAEERQMSKAGNAYLRYYILEATEHMRLSIPRFKAYYQAKYLKTEKHKHKRALVLTGRKALGLFVSLLAHQETYRAKEGEPALT